MVTATFWEGSGLGTLETHSGQTRTRRRNFKEQKTGDHILCLEADQSSSAGNGVEETICTGTAMVQQNIYDSSRTDISDPLVGYFLTVNKYSLPIFGLVKLVASHGYLKSRQWWSNEPVTGYHYTIIIAPSPYKHVWPYGSAEVGRSEEVAAATNETWHHHYFHRNHQATLRSQRFASG
ncbi:hypothetical protein DM860_000891 [Cuscuta australis]|uniref:Uncharacterized protein n=1 Tax=Cuscuta australis TaxID=267555 RepID=A0A328DWK9_9ASTE|nr:hypothetical protein DM860_000891 [Cuscuta australis]